MADGDLNVTGSRVDAHHHVWDLATLPQPWIDPVRQSAIARSFDIEELRAAAVAAGVVQTVVVQTVAVAEETPALLRLADRDPLVAGVVGWVDLTRADVEDAIARLRALPGGDRLVGVRHVVEAEPDPAWLDRPDVRAGLQAVARSGLSYDLLVFPHQLPAAVRTVRDLPTATFVLDHLGKPPLWTGDLETWAALLRELATSPNVHAKLSGLVTEADWDRWSVDDLRPAVDVALDAFGPQRLLWGSDWPVCLLATSYAAWVQASDELLSGLSDTERAAVLGDNARRVYRLTPDTH